MSSLVLRRACDDDGRLLWNLRNDAIVRASSFDSAAIPWTSHEAWLRARLASPDCRVWILEVDRTPVGQVRYERIADTAEVDIAVRSGSRRLGFGSALLTLSAERACSELGVAVLAATIKVDNAPSARTFGAAGYKRIVAGGPDVQTVLRFEYNCHRAGI